ncbi:hypothetical protein COY93_04005 [Candidatus Uhrbacteria bacterium CG_4_10_14_0_8_um_filter_58_22]|uniref:Uncharacterized protein n=1 Tax=Candidatus Uhrbacteria bacterium CG_4_10_14_0_8_um_filter_58_22 TaxID=1975029 RepID=A0A2M7Q9A1_9BACT|nr:MAG: hypothetical protein AUJ19_00435 [Parcubacteria group bacterium CG1_02_58_44]PIY62097.1 MAG: hypothetical protein COY93_04005 [Candidatus Uhrbacteria bacterium CG_4_10_14_0_8_um_filter_58_22]
MLDQSLKILNLVVAVITIISAIGIAVGKFYKWAFLRGEEKKKMLEFEKRIQRLETSQSTQIFPIETIQQSTRSKWR